MSAVRRLQTETKSLFKCCWFKTEDSEDNLEEDWKCIIQVVSFYFNLLLCYLNCLGSGYLQFMALKFCEDFVFFNPLE